MATQWGSTVQHERVGIDVVHPTVGSGTTQVDVDVNFYAQAVDYGFDDNQELQIRGPGFTDTRVPFKMYSPYSSTRTVFVASRTLNNVATSYSGGPTWEFSCRIYGQFLGGSPSHTRTYRLPARPATEPGKPTIRVHSATNSAATVDVGPADSNGAQVIEYQMQVDNNNTFTSPHLTWTGAAGSTDRRVTGLAEATTYYARARARNVKGWGPWSNVDDFRTSAEAPSAPRTFARSNITQNGATFTWIAPADNGGSTVRRYQVQRAENSAFTAGVATATTESLSYTSDSMDPGTRYWWRVRAENAVGYSPWSASVNFYTLSGVPEILSPRPGEMGAVGRLSTRIKSLGLSNGSTIRLEISQSPTFASGVQVTETQVNASSAGSYTINSVGYLKTGQWYIRARATNEETNYTTPWSATVPFTQAHAPNAVLVSPTPGQISKFAASFPLKLAFRDSASTDRMTAYHIQVENNLTGAIILNTGKVVYSPPAGVNEVTVTLPTTVDLKNTELRWRAMVWDQGDTESPWSSFAPFVLADPPVVELLSPAPATTINTGTPTVSWTFSAPSGALQRSVVVKITDAGNNKVVWTKTVTGTATTVSADRIVLRNLQNYLVTLDVTDSYGLKTTVNANFSTEYDAPSTVAYVIGTEAIADLGYVLVDWTQSNVDPLFTSWNVYRRPAGVEEWTLVTSITDPNQKTYRDYMVTTGQEWSYTVTQVAIRSGELIESTVGYNLIYDDVSETWIEALEDSVYYISIENYWLIDPDNPDNSVLLKNVIADDNTLEFEDESYHIIGRGRHRDYGDELGYTGSLTVQVRSTETPNRLRIAVETLRRSKETYYLRTPFGRLIQVALGNIAWSPLAGTGQMEMGDLTIPYEEVR